MSSTAPDVSQEALQLPSPAFERFLQAWKDGVEIAGPALFGCQAATPQDATHWHQLTPKLDVMRKKLPDRSQADAVFAAAMASFYNGVEGHKLMKKAGCESLGHLLAQLEPRRRSILAVLLATYREW